MPNEAIDSGKNNINFKAIFMSTIIMSTSISTKIMLISTEIFFFKQSWELQN